MVASLPILLIRPMALQWLGLPQGLLVQLLFMVLATALLWVPATFLTPSVDLATLRRFYEAVRPPGWWRPVAPRSRARDSWTMSLLQWGLGTAAILTTAMGPLEVLFGTAWRGWTWCAAAGLSWWGLAATITGRARRATG